MFKFILFVIIILANTLVVSSLPVNHHVGGEHKDQRITTTLRGSRELRPKDPRKRDKKTAPSPTASPTSNPTPSPSPSQEVSTSVTTENTNDSSTSSATGSASSSTGRNPPNSNTDSGGILDKKDGFFNFLPSFNGIRTRTSSETWKLALGSAAAILGVVVLSVITGKHVSKRRRQYPDLAADLAAADSADSPTPFELFAMWKEQSRRLSFWGSRPTATLAERGESNFEFVQSSLSIKTPFERHVDEYR